MKKITAVLLAVVLILTCVLAVACSGEVKVTFHYNNGSGTETQVYDPSKPLPTPERDECEFAGWFLDKQFTKPFRKGTEMKSSFHLYAKWVSIGADHIHDFGDSYFMYVQCNVEGCSVYGRTQTSQKYFTISDYTLDAKIDEIDAHYNELVENINNGNDQDQFDILWDRYIEDVEYVMDQGDLAYLLNDVYSDFDKYYDADEYQDTTIARYYGLFALVYESNYKEYAFEDWTEDEIQEVLELAARYNSNESDKSEVRDILQEYNNLLDQIGDNPTTEQYATLNSLYSRLVAANNAIASGAGYDNGQNYMDYAYANVYKREYTPSDVAEMRNYVKTVIAPIFKKIANEYYAFEPFTSLVNYNFYLGFVGLPIVDTVYTSNSDFNTISKTVNYIGDYFKYLSEVDGIDFFGEADKLFQKGNYFTGSGTGAYTGYFVDTPAVYFQTEGYSNAFTFVHEFGHYYNFVVNSDISASMDHNETQSQGDEMMFLAWLSQHKSSGITTGYVAVELEQLFSFLATIILSTAVDEFEQAAYAGTYEGEPITDYGQTFRKILVSYGGANLYLTNDYWLYVVFEHAAYYISYAMSALPCIELYAKAGTDGLNAARESYLKLFTYSSNSEFVGTDNYGDKVVTATYEQILNYCGLHSAFQSELYDKIQTYFASRK